MRAIKKVRRLIESDPTSTSAVELSKLIVSLESGEPFSFKQMYELPLNEFDLAVELIREWRLDRFYEGKIKALNAAIEAQKNE
jgi:hypothetical protein